MPAACTTAWALSNCSRLDWNVVSRALGTGIRPSFSKKSIKSSFPPVTRDDNKRKFFAESLNDSIKSLSSFSWALRCGNSFCKVFRVLSAVQAVNARARINDRSSSVIELKDIASDTSFPNNQCQSLESPGRSMHNRRIHHRRVGSRTASLILLEKYLYKSGRPP